MNATHHGPKAGRLADDDAARNFAPSEPAGAASRAEEAAGFDSDAPAAASAAVLSAIALMSSEPVRRLVNCDPAIRPPFVENTDVFDRRRHAYIAAKAAVSDPDRPHDDATAALLDAAVEIAEVLLLATPAALPYQSWTKFEVLEDAITDILRHGEPSAPRVRMALASFKHDLCRFDLGDGERVYPNAVP